MAGEEKKAVRNDGYPVEDDFVPVESGRKKIGVADTAVVANQGEGEGEGVSFTKDTP